MGHNRSKSDGHSNITVPGSSEKTPMPSSSPSPPMPGQKSDRGGSSTKQTIALIRRVLCTRSPPSTPIEEILPALTSSSAVDVELYAYIAIICRDFVYAWYQKITTDHEFIDEIVQVLAHCTRSLEQRVRRVDLETLCLDELPALLENHIKDYRLARERQSTSFSPNLTVNDIFHNIQPHPALSSSPESERVYLKLVGSGILSVLLPTEDLQSDCERSLLREILSSLVFWNIVDKLSEPHILFELIGKIFNRLNSNSVPPVNQSTASGNKIDNVADDGPKSMTSYLIEKLDSIFSFSAAATKTIKFVGSRVFSFIQNGPFYKNAYVRRHKSILNMSIFSCFKTVTSLDQRQPWVTGGLQLAAFPLSSLQPGSWIDLMLSDLFQDVVVQEEIVVQVLRLGRDALFPNDALSQPQPQPSEEEKTAIQKRAEEAILQCIPQAIKAVYFPPSKQEQLREISESLAFLKSRTCNKHLIYHLLDLVVARLLPELVDEAPSQLKNARVRMS